MKCLKQFEQNLHNTAQMFVHTLPPKNVKIVDVRSTPFRFMEAWLYLRVHGFSSTKK